MAILVLATTAPGASAADPKPTPRASSTIAPGPIGAPPLSVESIGAPITLPHDGTIVVQTIRSIAALSIDDLALTQPTSQALINDAAHVATTVTIGPFPAGTSLVFSLHSSFTNQTYLSTGTHAIVVADGPDKWAVGWEDWTDFNYTDELRARYYDPSSGRFTSTDPRAQPIAESCVGAYVYAGNNPIRRVDPSGRCPMTAAFVLLFGGLGTLAGPGGTVGGGALGAAAATAMCGLEVVAEVNLAKGIIDQRTGGVIPKPQTVPLWDPKPIEQPALLDPVNPQTGDYEPGPGPSSPLGGWKRTITLVLAVTTLAAILAGSEK